MEIYSILDDYKDIKECTYKGEKYSVRDNGAVFRHLREGKRIRKDDCVWTFGKPNMSTGYMEIGSERVHRIVAFAFLGEPPTPQHVVDHIDTNRRNNRPQNLRWLTKLENVLNNPITRNKIEYLCGSIEAFINDPSMIQEFVDDNPNFEWMRTVTVEEARASYERLSAWAERDRGTVPSGGSIGEWIYSPYKKEDHKPYIEDKEYESIVNEVIAIQQKSKQESAEESYANSITESLTPNAVQRYWSTPTEFPFCPSEIGEDALLSYMNNLKKGAIVSKNRNCTHFVDDYALNNNRLMISTYTPDGLKKYSIIYITFENGKYVHTSTTFFDNESTKREIALAKGLEWIGEETFDDYVS
ncbi:MAG: HNH endonuclease [Muribaculaceae bacterium]|nr:HNH endonuclease [Muribaculaceae bacterium]